MAARIRLTPSQLSILDFHFDSMDPATVRILAAQVFGLPARGPLGTASVAEREKRSLMRYIIENGATVDQVQALRAAFRGELYDFVRREYFPAAAALKGGRP